MEKPMDQPTLENLEKRVAALEKGLAQFMQTQPQPGAWKDWRLAIGSYRAGELAEEIDAAGREIREEDRRQTGQ
jgi:hypothetical protein